MWDREIEFPEHGMKIWEAVEVLKACLSDDEIKMVVEEMLGWPSKGYEVLDAHDFEMDV